MSALLDATREQIEALGALTDTLVSVERTISALLAARDGLLAMGSRLAIETADAARDDVSSPYSCPDGADLALRAVAAEFGAALRVSDRTVQRRMADADLLVTQFPALWRAQGAGDISPAHTRAIVDGGMHLDADPMREAYEKEMVEFALDEAPSRVARRARRVAERYQRRTLTERHRDARAQRAVWVTDRADGMAELGLLGPAALVQGAYERLTSMAKVVGTENRDARHSDAVGDDRPAAGESDDRGPDVRTLAQTRCDLALDLLLGGSPVGHDITGGTLGTIRGSVSVTVPVLTLMGLATAPAELDGHGPIDLDTARRLAGSAAAWDRVLTHPITGAVLAVDRYRPSADLKRLLQSQDQRCRFPTCGFPARECDLDHTRGHALGGETSSTNLAALCRRHHTLKHQSPWHVERLGGGYHAWTSPAGRVYVDAPPAPNDASIPHSTPPPF